MNRFLLVLLVSQLALSADLVGAQNKPIHRCDLPFKVKYNPTNEPNDCVSVMETRILQAIDLWNTASPNYTLLEYDGLTNDSDVICANCSSGVGPHNGENQIIWRVGGQGGCTCWHYPPGTDDIEKDVVLQGAEVHSCASPEFLDPNDYDVMWVLVHELGHVLGLDHPAPGACTGFTIMQPGVPVGVPYDPLVLGTCDITNIGRLYNPALIGSQTLEITNVVESQAFDPGTLTWDVNFTFDTNLSATSAINYDEFVSPPCTYNQQVTGPEAINHSVTIAGIPPAVDPPPLDAYCYKITARASSVESGCLPEYSGTFSVDAVTAEVTAYARAVGSGGLFALADTFATGCPQGDEEELVIEIDFDADATRDILPGELTFGQPVNGNVYLFGSSPPEADSAGTDENGFTTTITLAEYSGCGTDEIPILLNGIEVGRATVEVKSPDRIHTAGSSGKVDLADLSAFSFAYNSCAGEENYDACFDYVVEPLSCVQANDLGIFSEHYSHEFPGAGGVSAADPEVADVKLRVNVESVATGSFLVELRAERAKDIKTMAVVFAVEDDININGFTPASGFSGFATALPGRHQGDRLVLVAASALNEIGTGDGPVGTLAVSDPKTRAGSLPVTVARAEALNSRNEHGLVGDVALANQSTAETWSTALGQNYPNPFNPVTTIPYVLAEDGKVTLSIFSVNGRLVRTLVDGFRHGGRHEALWNGRDNRENHVATGVYWCRLNAAGVSHTRRMVLLK